MSDQHSLILGFYAGVAGVILVAGFLYKKFRDYREQRQKPKLPFPKSEEKSREHDHAHAATV